MIGNKKLLLAAALLVMASCAHDPFAGRGIRFSAYSTGYVNPETSKQTKTSYSGTSDSNGIERIDWADGDQIIVYSDKAYMYGEPDNHYCKFTVSSHEIGSGAAISKAAIIPVGTEHSLQWGTDAHTFYAMYPYPSGDNSFTEGSMVFEIPSQQSESPDMSIAPMLAANIGVAANSKEVQLAFTPQFSAFEITVGKGNFPKIDLTSFTIEAGSGLLAGTFTVEAGSYISVASIEDGSDSITVDLTGTNLDTTHPNLTLTVITLPQTLGSLKLTYTGTQIGTRSITLKNAEGTPINFAPYKKYKVYGLSFPVTVDTTIEDSIHWDYSLAIMDGIVWWLNADSEAFQRPEGYPATDPDDNLQWWISGELENYKWSNVIHIAGMEDNISWWLDGSLESFYNPGDVFLSTDEQVSWFYNLDGDSISWEDIDHLEISSDADAYLWRTQTVRRTAVIISNNGDAFSNVNTVWSSNNTNVARVDKNDGTVLAVSPGTAVITATLTPYGGSPMQASYTVYVNAPTSIDLSAGDNPILVSDSTTLTATVTCTANGTIASLPDDLLEWTSATMAAVTLADAQAQPALATGKATATANGVAAGTSEITVRVASKYADDVKATQTITVE